MFRPVIVCSQAPLDAVSASPPSEHHLAVHPEHSLFHSGLPFHHVWSSPYHPTLHLSPTRFPCTPSSANSSASVHFSLHPKAPCGKSSLTSFVSRIISRRKVFVPGRREGKGGKGEGGEVEGKGEGERKEGTAAAATVE